MNADFNNGLLNAMYSVAAALLATDGKKSFEESIISGLESICLYIDADRMHIWRNEMHNGETCYVNKYEWLTENGKKHSHPFIGTIFMYNNTPGWESKFLKNEHINCPVSQMTPGDRDFLSSYGLKSIIMIPLFLKNRLWGFFSADDCHNERTLPDDQIEFLRSAGLMMMNAIEHNQQEKRLHESQNYVKLILDATPLACRLWTRDYQILECNRQSLELFDLKDKQEYTEHYIELSPEFQPDGEKSREKFYRMMQQAFNEGDITMQWVFQKLDGSPIPAEISLVRVPYGDDYLVAGFTRDLREHNRMMNEIEHRDTLLRASNSSAVSLLSIISEDQFETSLAEGMKNIAEYMDVDRICIWQNMSIGRELCYKARYSWSNDMGLENPHIFKGMSFPVSVFSDEWNGNLLKGQCIQGPLSELSQKDHNLISKLGTKSILVIPMFIQGSFWGSITFDDCHGNRYFSDDETDILRSVGLMMISALLHNEMTQKIISANNAKSDFLAKMSHEMRTPLNAVLGFAELTLTEGGLNKDVEMNLEQIYAAGSTLLSLVNDILDISKVEAGKLEFIPSVYDVPSIINDAITQNIFRIGSKPIEFILDIDENMPSQLYGDELRVKQIFNNLLSNAFKYTRDGTIRLEINCAREKDTDTVWVTIKVTDTGIGIREENINALFSDFERFDTMANKNIEGTGLGLPITKRVVEAMGGHVSVESEFGKGSVFTVVIAQKFAGSDVIGKEMADSLKTFRYSYNKRTKNARLNRIKMPYARVLVVDDVVTNLNIAKGFLKPYGMKVDCVTNGQKAIDAVREEKYKYTAIFMDHMMPVMDGIEATRIIREEIGTEYAKTVPIIAFTANAIIGNEEMFLDKGFQSFVPKPIDVHRLDEVVRRWVRDKSKEKMLNMPIGINAKKTAITIEISGINMTKALSLFGGEADLFISALRSFSANTPEILERLEELSKDNNLIEYAVVVHGLKGSCANIGAEDLRERALDLEMHSKSGDISEVLSKNDSFIKDVRFLIENINAKLKEQINENNKPLLPAPDIKLLERLRQRCENYDMTGIEEVLEELDASDYEKGAGLITWIKNRLEMSEFIEVAARIAEYAEHQ